MLCHLNRQLIAGCPARGAVKSRRPALPPGSGGVFVCLPAAPTSGFSGASVNTWPYFQCWAVIFEVLLQKFSSSCNRNPELKTPFIVRMKLVYQMRDWNVADQSLRPHQMDGPAGPCLQRRLHSCVGPCLVTQTGGGGSHTGTAGPGLWSPQPLTGVEHV